MNRWDPDHWDLDLVPTVHADRRDPEGRTVADRVVQAQADTVPDQEKAVDEAAAVTEVAAEEAAAAAAAAAVAVAVAVAAAAVVEAEAEVVAVDAGVDAIGAAAVAAVGAVVDAIVAAAVVHLPVNQEAAVAAVSFLLLPHHNCHVEQVDVAADLEEVVVGEVAARRAALLVHPAAQLAVKVEGFASNNELSRIALHLW
uniref:Uncharacterized protein n=1 Tax=Plectus sambesii TaxID=2011161 RepID=A0A914VQA4_9BILA